MSAVDLDEPCSRHFRYRDFIECGETWQRLATSGLIDNVPRNPATLRSMRELAAMLDQVVDEFGVIRLTYGFASSDLTRHIRKGIAPRLDQHAGSEPRRDGLSVCARGGLAVDFFIEGMRTSVVARWLAQHVAFDRLYMYGDDRPFHVSTAARPSGRVYRLRDVGGRRVPERIRATEIEDAFSTR